MVHNERVRICAFFCENVFLFVRNEHIRCLLLHQQIVQDLDARQECGRAKTVIGPAEPLAAAVVVTVASGVVGGLGLPHVGRSHDLDALRQGKGLSGTQVLLH